MRVVQVYVTCRYRQQLYVLTVLVEVSQKPPFVDQREPGGERAAPYLQRQRDSLCVRLTSHKTLTPTLLAIVGTSLR
jgi:hypothetical protein